MESTQVRQGNIISYKGYERVVESILPNKIKVKGAETFMFASEYEPVLLTDEILIKLGFVKQIGCIFVNKICLRNGIRGKYQFRISDGLDFVLVKHLHQLQNIYFISIGEELIKDV